MKCRTDSLDLPRFHTDIVGHISLGSVFKKQAHKVHMVIPCGQVQGSVAQLSGWVLAGISIRGSLSDALGATLDPVQLPVSHR